jgi:hypothetical protein
MKSNRKFVGNIFDFLFKLRKAIQLINSLGHLEKRIANLEMHVPMLTNQTIERVQQLSRVLQPKQTGLKMVRIGNSHDGGYVVSSLNKENMVLSLGVGDEFSADIELIEKYGSQIYAFDPFVTRPKVPYKEFNFFQIGCRDNSLGKGNLEFKTLEEILKFLPKIPDLAFIDIEGDEWQIGTDISLLGEVSQIVIEFHDLHKIIDNHFYNNVLKLVDTLLASHTPVHVHGNNDGSTVPIGGSSWPSILEVTFLRTDLFQELTSKDNLGPWPTKLDSPNSPNRPDIDLNPFFGVLRDF